MGIWPKVSIILVNYNGYRDTIECLQSLRKITYPNHEVVVIDNASTNESVEEIGDFIREGEILIPSEVNGGFSAGNNIGIKYAIDHNADYCLLLNNDTEVQKDFLTELVKTAERYQRKAVITLRFITNKMDISSQKEQRLLKRLSHVVHTTAKGRDSCSFETMSTI